MSHPSQLVKILLCGILHLSQPCLLYTSYNLGNAYFQQGDLGQAIVSYEQAAQLAPARPRCTPKPGAGSQPSQSRRVSARWCSGNPGSNEQPLADRQRAGAVGAGRLVPAGLSRASLPALPARPPAGRAALRGWCRLALRGDHRRVAGLSLIHI